LAVGRPRSGGLVAAGVLNLISGVLGLIVAVILMTVFLTDPFLPFFIGPALGPLCGALFVAFSIGSIAGGVYCLKRERYAVCIFGSVMSMVAAAAVVGFFLGIIALVLVVSSREEFLDQPPPPPPVIPMPVIPFPMAGAPAGAVPRRFCSRCGTPVRSPDDRCPSCGASY
jgi:hypothetical protein